LASHACAGIITAVAIQCVPRPAATNVMLLAVRSFAAVTAVLGVARRRLGEVLSAAEFLDAACMRLVCHHLPGVVNPLQPTGGGPGQPSVASGGAGSGGRWQAPASTGACVEPAAAADEPPFYVLIETQGSNPEHDTAKLQDFLEVVISDSLRVCAGVAENLLWS
jgi:FAD/FMN-containing dehydrogenase